MRDTDNKRRAAADDTDRQDALPGVDTSVTRAQPGGGNPKRPDMDPDVGKEVGTEADTGTTTGLRGGGD